MNNIIIHSFETYKHYYVYDVNTNLVVEVDGAMYQKIQKRKFDNSFEKLQHRGLFLNRREFEMKHPFNDQLECALERNLKSMTLQVTKNCNLRCKYCVYSGSYLNRSHSNERMSEKVAYDALNFFLEHSIDSESVDIGFYGGEPTLEFPLIRKCIEHIEENKGSRVVQYSLTTNATLLTYEMIDFFNQYGVDVTISLDGPQHIHDTNRIMGSDGQGSFDKVMDSLKNIEDRWKQYKGKVNFNAVMSPENGFEIYSDFFCNEKMIENFSAVVNLPSENYNTSVRELSEEFVEEFNYEVFKYYFSILRKDIGIKQSKLVRQHFQRLVDNIHSSLKFEIGKVLCDHHSGPCVVGRHRLFIDTNGKMFPCERVSESSDVMNIGDIYSGFSIKKVRQLLNIGKLTEKECKNCWAFRFCTICAVKADCGGKLLAKHKLKYCNSVRNSIDDRLKDYYTFIEKGYDFEREL